MYYQSALHCLLTVKNNKKKNGEHCFLFDFGM